jgi:serine phosphatase RsbU (regulator of sigma subunit)/streptogramin lyase
MWILTWDGGLLKMDRAKGTFKQYARDPEKPATKKQPAGNRIKGFYELEDGRILLGFFAGGGAPSDSPYYFDPEKETFEPFPIMEFLHNKDTMENMQIKNSSCILNFIHQDKKGNFWFGSYSGLLHFDMKAKVAKRVTGIPFTSTTINLENVRSIVEDDEGNFWVPTSNTGVMIVNPETFQCRYIQNSPKVSTSLSDNRIRSIKKDKMGNIWVATGAGGFSVFFPIVNQFTIHPWDLMGFEYSNRSAQIIPVNMMRVRNSRQVYISNQNGIAVYDPEMEKVVEYYRIKSLNGGNQFSLDRVDHFAFRNDRLFFNSQYEIGYFDLQNKKVKYIPRFDDKRNMIKMFRHEKDLDTQFYYYSYWSGVTYMAMMNDQSNQLDSFFRFKDSVKLTENYQFILNDGRWLLSCGPRGFMLFNPNNKQYEIFGPDAPGTYFPDSLIRTAYEDPEGIVWFTSENGLYSFDPKSEKHQCWNDSLGLNKQGTNAIVSDLDGIYWIALDDEIMRWDKTKNEKIIFGKNLGLRVGSFLPSNPQLDENGKVYMATLFGILSFDPRLVKIPNQKPVLNLASVVVQSDTLDVRDSAMLTQNLQALKWNQNFLEFSFYTDQLVGPRPPAFYYRTIGLDTVWRENGSSNKIRYSNLSHGIYTLEVKMVNAYGLESNTLRITFTIARPFWLTWWFLLIVACLIALGIWKYIKYREQSHLKLQQELEQRVEERTAEVVEKAEEIKLQKDIIFEKNKELTDSIHYAQRIQQSILPDAKAMKKSMPDHFVLFKPKDIVSGDFYWYAHHGDSILWAVVDCTGHGVPGGFMSMLGAGLLGQIVNEEQILQPDKILNEMRERLIIALRQTGEEGDSRDGMDISIARWKVAENKIEVAAAHNSVYVIRDGVMTELKADKQPIGIHGGEMKPFALHEYNVHKGDVIFMSSDGYYDQFGGEKGKKFKSSNFEKLLASISNESSEMQFQLLEQTFVKWKGEFEQIDDVCVIGVRVS